MSNYLSACGYRPKPPNNKRLGGIEKKKRDRAFVYRRKHHDLVQTARLELACYPVCIRDLRPVNDLPKEVSTRKTSNPGIIFTIPSLNHNIGKTDKTDNFNFFANIF